MSMKKKAGILLALAAVLGAGMVLGACALRSGAWKWEQKVTFITPWSASGGSGPVIRGIVPLVQDVIGSPCEIQHIEGAGGANGIIAAWKQPADGYNFVLCTQSIILLDIQKLLPFNWKEEFVPVAKLVHSTNGIFASPTAMNGKFSGWRSLIAYINANPGILKIGVVTAGGVDQAGVMMVFSEGLGIPLDKVFNYVNQVSYHNVSDLNSALIYGLIDLGVGGPGELEVYFRTGFMIPLILLTEKRNSRFPDIPASAELGINATLGQWRGIFARKGTPQAAIDAMEKALYKAYNTPDYQQFCKNNGYLERRGFDGQAEFQKIIDRDYDDLTVFAKAAGLAK